MWWSFKLNGLVLCRQVDTIISRIQLEFVRYSKSKYMPNSTWVSVSVKLQSQIVKRNEMLWIACNEILSNRSESLSNWWRKHKWIKEKLFLKKVPYFFLIYGPWILKQIIFIFNNQPTQIFSYNRHLKQLVRLEQSLHF